MNSRNHVLDPARQAEDQPAKIVASLERIGHIILTSMREAAQNAGLSPIQARILIHIGTHAPSDTGMSTLAAFFDITVPTVSDAVNSLVQKGLVIKKRSPVDARARVLGLTDQAHEVLVELASWSAPLEEVLEEFTPSHADTISDGLLRMVAGLHDRGRVSVAPICPYCTHFTRPSDSNPTAFCQLLATSLSPSEYRLDCPEWQAPQ